MVKPITFIIYIIYRPAMRGGEQMLWSSLILFAYHRGNSAKMAYGESY